MDVELWRRRPARLVGKKGLRLRDSAFLARSQPRMVIWLLRSGPHPLLVLERMRAASIEVNMRHASAAMTCGTWREVLKILSWILRFPGKS